MRYNQCSRREVFFRDTPGAVGEAKPGIAEAAEGLRALPGIALFIPFGQTRLGRGFDNSAKGTKAVNRSKGYLLCDTLPLYRSPNGR